MKKRMVRLISCVLLGVMCISLLSACVSFDRAEDRLREAGYTVVRYGKGAPDHLVDAVDESVKSSLVATGGPNGEQITIIRFKDKDLAKQYEQLQKKAYETSYFYTVARDGKTVIVGWTNAYDIIK